MTGFLRCARRVSNCGCCGASAGRTRSRSGRGNMPRGGSKPGERRKLRPVASNPADKYRRAAHSSEVSTRAVFRFPVALPATVRNRVSSSLIPATNLGDGVEIVDETVLTAILNAVAERFTDPVRLLRHAIRQRFPCLEAPSGGSS